MSSNATISESATTLEIEVDNFNDSNDAPLSSYLRLGAVPSAEKTRFEALVDDNSCNDNVSHDTTHGDDLAAMVLEFVDDSRYRGSNNTDKFYTNSNAERAALTDTLHTAGGWREHTDGNRVSTTRGDKVEVIYGNYKLMVLGREQWNSDNDKNPYGGGLHHESSGGITYHYDEVPGQIVDVRWSDSDGTWKLMEECDTGHFVCRYHGVDKDWFRGGDVVTRVGSKTAYDSLYGTSGAHDNFDSDSDFDKPSDASHLAGVTWPSDSTLPSVREEIFCSTLKERTFANEIIDKDGSSSRKVDTMWDHLYAKTIDEFNMYGANIQGTTGNLAKEKWIGGFFEFFLNVAMFSLKMGLFIEGRGGGVYAIYGGLAQVDLNLLLGPRTTLTLAGQRFSHSLVSYLCKVRNCSSWIEFTTADSKEIAGIRKVATAFNLIL